MGGVRGEPFQLALRELRERLRTGRIPPGGRIAASEIADQLRLSATPVREALSRLAGEGLVEDRRGQGFFVRSLSGADIADLFRLSLACLDIAQAPGRAAYPGRLEAAPVGEEEPVRAVERLFARWAAEGGSRALAGAHRSIALQIGPVRRLEPLLFDDLAEEAAALRALSEPTARSARAAALERFHARRVAHAERLAALLEQRADGGTSIDPI